MADERWFVIQMERPDHVLLDAVRIGCPTMLTLVLKPAFDRECFKHDAFARSIFVEAPLHGPVAAANAFHGAHGGHEFRHAGGIDPIFDCDQNRTAVDVPVAFHLRVGPMKRGREIERGSRFQPEEGRDQYSDDKQAAA